MPFNDYNIFVLAWIDRHQDAIWKGSEARYQLQLDDSGSNYIFYHEFLGTVIIWNVVIAIVLEQLLYAYT